MNNSKLIKALSDLYNEEVERVGFVMKKGKLLVEVENVCVEPGEGFDVKGEDILKYAPLAYATFHTHPGADNNLSVNDFASFLNFPDLSHFIIGNNGVRRYYVEEGEVLVDA